MGIKFLNKFFMDNCNARSIRKLSLQYLEKKVVVVDTSIYLYKFAEKGDILENLYLMISVFRHYGITPVFVFDGKPPIEKKELLIKRKLEKQAAEDKYNELQLESAESGLTIELEQEMEKLKRQFVRVCDTDIQGAKLLMRAYGITYFESRGESDQLCAYLVKHNYAWACMSDDMDMFLYGCPRVLRHMSLMKHDVVFYDTEKILADLDMSHDTFLDITVLSGTDYNVSDTNSTLAEIVDKYTKYRAYLYHSGKEVAFVDWLVESEAYILDVDRFRKTREMFDLDQFSENKKDEIKRVIDSIPFRLEEFQVAELQEVLRDDGFIFI
jgi:flap endonuclease-1